MPTGLIQGIDPWSGADIENITATISNKNFNTTNSRFHCMCWDPAKKVGEDTERYSFSVKTPDGANASTSVQDMRNSLATSFNLLTLSKTGTFKMTGMFHISGVYAIRLAYVTVTATDIWLYGTNYNTSAPQPLFCNLTSTHFRFYVNNGPWSGYYLNTSRNGSMALSIC